MRLLTLIRKANPAIAIIIFTSTALVAIWFRSGNIMGVAESGLAFNDFGIQYQFIKDAWESYTLGFTNNIGVASIPMYWFFSILQHIGVPSVALQMFFFWIILIMSGMGIFLLSRQFFPKLEDKFLLLPVFFYWFNPFALINIWNRFLTNFLFSYAFIPLALYLFISGINKKKYLYAILIGLLSLICSHAETAMTYNVLFWLIVFYTTMFSIFTAKDWVKRAFIIKFFLLTFIFWFLINIWWIGQVVAYYFVGSFNTVSSSSFTTFGNYQTFSILSSNLGNLVDLVRLNHNYFFTGYDFFWTSIFNTPLFSFVGFIMASLVLVSMVFTKNRVSFFFGGLFLIGIFFSKGNNPPFGEINDKLFFSFPLMQLFRNPFEKFGYLLAFSSAFLSTASLNLLYTRINPQYKRFLFVPVFLAVVFVWGWPFWSGYVFVGFEKPTNNPKVGYQVVVPEYYKEASKWLDSQKEDFRIIALPLGGEGITYKWQKGYSGVELTNQLLPKSAISFNTNFPFYDEISKNIERLLLTTDYMDKISNSLDVKYIMLREDIDWNLRKMKNPSSVRVILNDLEKKGELKKVAQFGALSFWEILSRTKEKIYTANSALIDYSQPKIQDLDFSRNNLVINTGEDVTKKMSDQTEGEILHPQAQFFLDHLGENYFEIRQDIFPYVSILPQYKKYPLVLIKDKLEENAIKDQGKLLDFRLILLGKRLVEAKFSADLNQDQGIILATKGYTDLLDRTFKLVEEFEDSDQGGQQAALQSRLYLTFSKHIKVLEDITKKTGLKTQTRQAAVSTLEQLRRYLTEAYIYPTNGFLISDQFPVKRRILYSFEVKDSGDYEIFWDKIIVNSYYKLSIGDQINLQIDNKFVSTTVIDDEKGHISLGKINFSKGIHEIGINLPDALNLLDTPTQQINFKVDHGKQVRFFSVLNYDPYSSYSIDFNYWIKKGNGVTVAAYDKMPNEITSVTKTLIAKVIGPDLYDYTAKNYALDFRSSGGSDQATISLTVTPWNDCISIYFSKGRKVCNDVNFKSKYDKTTEIDINDLSVTRDFNDLPMLVKTDPIQTIASPKIEFTKIDQTTYRINIEDAIKPYFLIFSELFDPGWKILDSTGQLQNYPHYLANGYANSWYVDKEGNYQMILKFTPQQWLTDGEKISFGVALIGLIFVISRIGRRKNA